MTNVTIKDETKWTKPFGRLCAGDYFLANGYAWIKVMVLDENDYNILDENDYNAVRLSDGDMWHWDNETEVLEIQNVTISFN